MSAKEKPKNIQIPLELFKKIFDFFECLDIRDCDTEFQNQYREIFSALLAKQDSMDLRGAYAGVVFAKDDEQRKQARKAYLEQKELNNL